MNIVNLNILETNLNNKPRFVCAVQGWPSFVYISAHTLSVHTNVTSAAKRTALWPGSTHTGRTTPMSVATCAPSAANASKPAMDSKATWGDTLGNDHIAAPIVLKISQLLQDSMCTCGGTQASGLMCVLFAVKDGRLVEIYRSTWGHTQVNGRTSVRTAGRLSPSPATWPSTGGSTLVRQRRGCGGNTNYQFSSGMFFFSFFVPPGEKPYSCPECGKCLRRKFDLKKHMLSHSSVRPYTCMYCSKSYTRKTHLNRHLLTHKSVDSQAAIAEMADEVWCGCGEDTSQQPGRIKTEPQRSLFLFFLPWRFFYLSWLICCVLFASCHLSITCRNKYNQTSLFVYKLY